MPLPSDTSKLLTKWQGPFEVQQKVLTPGQTRPSRLLHVNLFKEWVERADEIAKVLPVRGVPEDEETNIFPHPQSSVEFDSDDLSEEQQLQVRALCKLGCV